MMVKLKNAPHRSVVQAARKTIGIESKALANAYRSPVFSIHHTLFPLPGDIEECSAKTSVTFFKDHEV